MENKISREQYIGHLVRYEKLDEEIHSLGEFNIGGERDFSPEMTDSQKIDGIVSAVSSLTPERQELWMKKSMSTTRKATLEDLIEAYENSPHVGSLLDVIKDIPYDIDDEVMKQFEEFVKSRVDLAEKLIVGVSEIAQINKKREQEFGREFQDRSLDDFLDSKNNAGQEVEQEVGLTQK